MRPLLAWTRVELRRRWRSLVVLALLVAVAGATVMTALAGAHRGATALERLAEDTLATDAMVLPNTAHFDWDPVRELEYVEALSEFALGAGVALADVEQDGIDFLHADDEFGRTIERPVVLEGRRYDATSPDEAVMSPLFAETYGLEVGDVLPARLATPEQAEAGADGVSPDEYAGPRVDIEVVGVVRSPWAIDQPGSNGTLMISPGLFEQYRPHFMGTSENAAWTNAQLRLENGAADLPRLRQDVGEITGRSDIDVWNLADDRAEIQSNLDFEARCLAAFALAALLAGLVLVGQAIARYAAAESDELRTGRALGMTPRQTVATAVVGPCVAAAAGSALAVAAAVAASAYFPIGSAAGIEPDPGVDVDWLRLGGVALVVVALATAGAAVTAAIGLRGPSRSRPRLSPVAGLVASTGLPVPLVIGTRFALERGVGRSSMPVLPALVGAVAGVLGVVAAFSFSHGVDDAIAHPERFGQTYQAFAFGGFNGEEFLPLEQVGDAVRSLDYVTGVNRGRIGAVTGVDGGGSVELWSYDIGEKSLPTVVTRGRMPESQEEVLLTPGSLETLGAEVGETIALEGSRGPRDLLVVGTGFVPTGPHNSYNTGGFVTSNGFGQLFGKTFKFSILFVSVAPSARGEGLGERLTADVVAQVPELGEAGPLFGDPGSEGLDVSSQIGQLEQIRVLPLALGVFLALLALGAVGHALATATRRRAHDLAVLRATGMTPWQSRGVVVSQATVLVLVGLVFGLPVGLAVGRTVWRLVADYTPLEYVPPTAAVVLSLVGPVALLMAYVVAAWPAARSSGLRIAHVLRTE